MRLSYTYNQLFINYRCCGVAWFEWLRDYRMLAWCWAGITWRNIYFTFMASMEYCKEWSKCIWKLCQYLYIHKSNVRMNNKCDYSWPFKLLPYVQQSVSPLVNLFWFYLISYGRVVIYLIAILWIYWFTFMYFLYFNHIVYICVFL